METKFIELLPFEFADEVIWPTEALQTRLGELATNIHNIAYTETRGRQVTRESNHVLFELEQRGAIILPETVDNLSGIAPLRRRSKLK
jgi:hypothetical protein